MAQNYRAGYIAAAVQMMMAGDAKTARRAHAQMQRIAKKLFE